MRYLMLLFFALSVSACQKKHDVIEPLYFANFNGDYIVEITQTILEAQYDSVGHFMGMKDVPYYFTDTIKITQLSSSDSVSIFDLPRGQGKINLNDKVEQHQINLDHDWSSLSQSVWLRGTLELQGDSLFLDYSWNSSDIWTQGALPSRGRVIGKGIR